MRPEGLIAQEINEWFPVKHKREEGGEVQLHVRFIGGIYIHFTHHLPLLTRHLHKFYNEIYIFFIT